MLMMKHRMERLVAFPFVTGCASSSSVAVCVQHVRRTNEEDIDLSHLACRSFVMSEDHKVGEGALTSSDNMMKSSFRFTSLSKPNVSIRLQRLTKSIKSLSQSLVFREETEKVQIELKIGLPTDVKHVAHVGFDGSVTSEANHHGDLATSDFLGFCPISFARLEDRLAMYMPLDTSHDTENILPDVIHAGNKTDARMA